MNPLQHIEKLLYIFVFAPVKTSWRLLGTVLTGLVATGRPSSRWTLQQAVAVRLMKSLLQHLSTLRVSPRLSLRPGNEGERFALVRAADAGLYAGPLADADIRPRTLGGTWTPRAPYRAIHNRPESILIALHFHGGAYMLGNGRDSDTGFLAEILLKRTEITHVFTPQYRLASAPQGRFPAALQDALSSYLYLVNDLGIHPSRIVLGGDSAGGNLALALLRYLHDFGNELGIGHPRATLLWSPWTDVPAGCHADDILTSTRYKSDYLDVSFALWGVSRFTDTGKISPSDPYVFVAKDPGFHIEGPVWVHTGGLELLYDDNRRFVEVFRSNGTSVTWDVDEHCPHDIGLMGRRLGFEKEAVGAAKRAGEFLRAAVQ